MFSSVPLFAALSHVWMSRLEWLALAEDALCRFVAALFVLYIYCVNAMECLYLFIGTL